MNILVTEPYLLSAAVREKLTALGRVTYGPFDRKELKEQVYKFDVILIRLGHYFDVDLMESCVKLKYLVSATTGVDHIDIESAKADGIRVITLRDRMDRIESIASTAEHTWALLLALVRCVPAAVEHVRSGGWDRDLFWGTELAGKQLGIIGYGRIGRKVAQYAHAFGMRVAATDVRGLGVTKPVELLSFDEVIENSDIISVHANMHERNRNLLDEGALSRVRAGCWLVNTARGKLVDEAAVYRALVDGVLAGYACDVVEDEERDGSSRSLLVDAMRQGYRVLVTPHIGGATIEAITNAEMIVVDELCNALAKT